MAECIDREALIKALEADFNTDWNGYSKVFQNVNYVNGVRDEYDDVLKIIREQPTIETIHQLENELSEAKRLLKLAVEDFSRMDNHIYSCDGLCDDCPLSGERDHCLKWRYADETRKLLPEPPKENHDD